MLHVHFSLDIHSSDAEGIFRYLLPVEYYPICTYTAWVYHLMSLCVYLGRYSRKPVFEGLYVPWSIPTFSPFLPILLKYYEIPRDINTQCQQKRMGAGHDFLLTCGCAFFRPAAGPRSSFSLGRIANACTSSIRFLTL